MSTNYNRGVDYRTGVASTLPWGASVTLRASLASGTLISFRAPLAGLASIASVPFLTLSSSVSLPAPVSYTHLTLPTNEFV